MQAANRKATSQWFKMNGQLVASNGWGVLKPPIGIATRRNGRRKKWLIQGKFRGWQPTGVHNDQSDDLHLLAHLALLLQTELNSTIFHIQGSSKCVIHANVCFGACFVYRCLEAIVSDVVALLGCRHRCWLMLVVGNSHSPKIFKPIRAPHSLPDSFDFFAVIRGCMLGYIYNCIGYWEGTIAAWYIPLWKTHMPKSLCWNMCFMLFLENVKTSINSYMFCWVYHVHIYFNIVAIGNSISLPS